MLNLGTYVVSHPQSCRSISSAERFAGRVVAAGGAGGVV